MVYIGFFIQLILETKSLKILYEVIAIGIPIMTISCLHYLFSRKYLKFALQFANVSSFIFVVGALELSISIT